LIGFNVAANGTSFFGSATSGSYIIPDYPAYTTYTGPSFLFSGGVGSDEMIFSQAGVYLLQFRINAFLISSVNAVDIISSSALSGVSVIGSSANYTATSSNAFASFDVISASSGGTIILPSQTVLLTLYGPNWSGCRCVGMNVIRLY